jgi:hypothetical protein
MAGFDLREYFNELECVLEVNHFYLHRQGGSDWADGL